MLGRRAHIHPFHILLAFLNIALGNHIGFYVLLQCLFNNLIIHIREIGNKIHLIPFIFKITANRVKNNHRTGISNVD